MYGLLSGLFIKGEDIRIMWIFQ